MTIEHALGLDCIYVDGKDYRYGPVDLKEATRRLYPIILSPMGMRDGEYTCVYSSWDDIKEAPVIQHLIKELPRTTVIMRGGRQALKFEEGDTVFIKMLFHT